MRVETLKIYKFGELSEQAKQTAIEEVRNEYYEYNDFDFLAVDNDALFEPKEKELIELFGGDYKFPLIENTRKSIYFDTDRNRFLDCEKAMQITNEKQFLLWLGIDIEDEAFENIYFEIITPNYRNASTEIRFYEYDEMFEDRIETAVEKFNSLIRDILERIEADIDYRFTDEAIIGDIEANDYEFLSNGKKY